MAIVQGISPRSMAKSGYPILNNGTSGLVPVIVKRGHLMPSIVLERVVAACLILMTSSLSSAYESPRFLRDPLLGARYELAKVKFEPVSREMIAACAMLAGSKRADGVWFIYARTHDATGKIYYIIDGYEIRRRPRPPDLPRYDGEGFGMIIGQTHDRCEVIEADARQVFADRVFEDDLPQHVMTMLADDYASRMARAFGGSGRLALELKAQRIDTNALPTELRGAFKSIGQTPR
jgi:hypothetical protein